MTSLASSVRRRGVGWANPWWITLMLVAVVFANVRFGDRDSEQLGSWVWSPLALSFVVVALLPVVLPSRTPGDEHRSAAAPRPVWALIWVFTAVAGLVFGLTVYNRNAPALEVIAVELGEPVRPFPTLISVPPCLGTSR